MAEYGLEDITDLKKNSAEHRERPGSFQATPDPKQVAEYLRGTKSSGLKAVLRNEFEKIGRARITLGQIAEELREYRAKNIVGKAEPAGGWGDLKDPDTNKKIICTSRGEYNLEVRRCVAAAKIKKSGKACKNYLVAIVTKMKIENKEKQQEKIIEKAKKREKELAMIKPEGAMMKGKVKIFADALKLSGDSGSWSSETLATKIDAETGRQLCQEAFAAKREQREAKSMMISVKRGPIRVVHNGLAIAQPNVGSIAQPNVANIGFAQCAVIEGGPAMPKSLGKPNVGSIVQTQCWQTQC
eukprot:g45296.t1